MLELIILLLCVLISALIGYFVYLRNPKAITNQLYGLLTLEFLLFAIANYLSLHTSQRLLFIRVVIFFASLAISTLYFFVAIWLRKNNKLRYLDKFVLGFTLLVISLELTPFVFTGLSEGLDPVPIPGVAAPVFLLHFLLIPILITAQIVLRIPKESGDQKLQSAYILLGIAPIILLAPVTSFVMPVVFHNAKLIILSPIYVLFFVTVIGYVIIRHKLFDLRFYVIRASTYILTVGLVTLFIAMPSFWAVAKLLHISTSGFVLFALSAVSIILIFLYGYIKQVFDRLTYGLFFRHYYDSQDVLDRLSSLLVHTIDLDQLRIQSKKILNTALHTSSFEYVINNRSNTSLNNRFEKYFKKVDTVIIVDELEEESAAPLRRDDIGALIRLRTTHGDLGYIVLGYKQSGQSYTVQDKRLLTTAADEIAISVQNSLHFEEIQHFNHTLQERVRKATAELSATNEKLRKLDETKDEFITMASHQLRTPLTSVKGYLSMVLEGDVGKLNPQQRQMLTQSYMSSQRMVFLISDLLNLSRLNTGKFVIERTAVDINEIVELEIDQLRETAKAREVSLVYVPPASFPKLMLDETKTHQVVMNLLDNAIYYTRPGGTVTIELVETPTSVEYRVKDNGIGVPRSEQRHLFTKFYRANNAKQARPDGTGLGLFMAKKVIAAQGGSIIFSSEEGKGSTFGFRFNKPSFSIDLEAKPEATKTA